jgi:transcriptional regulator with XRE-family HTH domain
VASAEDLELIDDPLELFRLASAAIAERQAEIDRLATIRMRSLAALYATGISYRELATALGMSAPRVSQLVGSNEEESMEVLKAWVAVEKTLNDIAKALGLEQNGSAYSDVRSILAGSGGLDSNALSDLDELRGARNALTHNRLDISRQDAERLTSKAIYLNAALTRALGRIKDRSDNENHQIGHQQQGTRSRAAFDDNLEAAEGAEAVIERFNAALDRLPLKTSIQSMPSTSRDLFWLAYGWWAFIVRSSDAVLVLRRSGLEHEASPIVRTILQHSLTLQWLVDTGDDAVDAVREYAESSNRQLLKTMSQSEWPPVKGLTIEMPPKRVAPGPLVTRLRNFALLCKSYNAEQLYVPLRLLSSYVHPTTVGAWAYIDDASGELSPTATSASNALIIQTALCLTQATKTFNRLLADDSLSNTIDQAEEIIGVEVEEWPRR